MNVSSLPLLLIAIWAGLLVAFMVLRPSPDSRLFWLFIVSAVTPGAVYMVLSHLESRRNQLEATAWIRRLN